MTRFRGLLLMVALASCKSADAPATTTTPERRCAAGENLQMCGKNLVIAHRGGAKLWPEETLLAMQEAVKAGSDVLEIDVHATSDGKVICMHDEDVDRTTDGTGKVKEKTLADVLALDAAAKFTTDGGKTFPHKGKGIKVALLDDLLKAFPAMPFSIEIKQYKPSIVDAVLAIVEANKMTDRVVIASFDDDTIREVRTKRPNIPTSLAAGEIIRILQIKEVDEIGTYVPPAKLFQAPYEAITAERMAAYNKLGIRVHVWTVDDRYDQDRLWKLGVHGIMSDDPVLLKTVTKELGLDADKGK